MHSLSAAALLVLSRQLLATSPLGVGFIEGSIRIVGMGISIREHQDDDSQCIVIDYTSKQALGLHKDSSHPLSVKSAVCMELVGTTPQQKSLPRGFELSGAEEGALKGVYVRRLYAEDPTVNKTGSNLQDGEQWTLFDRKHVEVQALDAQVPSNTPCEGRFRILLETCKEKALGKSPSYCGRHAIRHVCRALRDGTSPVQETTSQTRTTWKVLEHSKRRLRREVQQKLLRSTRRSNGNEAAAPEPL